MLDLHAVSLASVLLLASLKESTCAVVMQTCTALFTRVTSNGSRITAIHARTNEQTLGSFYVQLLTSAGHDWCTALPALFDGLTRLPPTKPSSSILDNRLLKSAVRRIPGCMANLAPVPALEGGLPLRSQRPMCQFRASSRSSC